MAEIIGFAGSYNQPSRTRALVASAAHETAARIGVGCMVFDLGDIGPSLGTAWSVEDLAPRARALLIRLIAADAIVVGSPVYKGSYTGLFKHFIDLIEPEALRGKPVLLTATGGGDRHALVIEHQLRPLFGFFEAACVPTGVYASAADFAADRPASPALAGRLDVAISQLSAALSARGAAAARQVIPAA